MRRTERGLNVWGNNFVTIRTRPNRVVWVLTLMAAGLVSGAPSWPTHDEQMRNPTDPQSIRADDSHRTVIGLVYSPELLASLGARQASESMNQRIAEAVRQETPIVIMWAVPIPPEVGPDPPPYKIAIMERGGPEDPNRIEPVWLQQDATALGQLEQPRSPDGGGCDCRVSAGCLCARPLDLPVFGLSAGL
jgi:hypothetical protein